MTFFNWGPFFNRYSGLFVPSFFVCLLAYLPACFIFLLCVLSFLPSFLAFFLPSFLSFTIGVLSATAAFSPGYLLGFISDAFVFRLSCYLRSMRVIDIPFHLHHSCRKKELQTTNVRLLPNQTRHRHDFHTFKFQ